MSEPVPFHEFQSALKPTLILKGDSGIPAKKCLGKILQTFGDDNLQRQTLKNAYKTVGIPIRVTQTSARSMIYGTAHAEIAWVFYYYLHLNRFEAKELRTFDLRYLRKPAAAVLKQHVDGSPYEGETDGARIENTARANDSWRLIEGDLKTIDAVDCTVYVSLTQHSDQNDSLGVIGEVNLRPLHTDCEISYSFKSVGLRAIFNSQFENSFWYCENWKTETSISRDCRAQLVNRGKESTFLLTSDFPLRGEYVLSEYELFYLQPATNKLDFVFQMIVQPKGLHITGSDGVPLPSANKQNVIKCLIAAKIGSQDNGGWIPIASRKYELLAINPSESLKNVQ